MRRVTPPFPQTARKRWGAYVFTLNGDGQLEAQVQRHLKLARAADGVGNDAEATGTAIKTAADSSNTCRAAGSGQDGCSRGREGVVAGVLRDLVAGNVEARGVGQVVDIERVLEIESIGQFRVFDERSVGALLEGLAEDVALPGGEAGLVWVIRWDG